MTITNNTGSTSITLQDLNATYGTFLGTGVRLNPGQSYPLRAGDTFLLANGGPAFVLERKGQ